MSCILVFGSSVVDIFGFCGNRYKQSDSIPGTVKISFGGVSRNIAENMARVGVDVKFISILGDDEIGRSMLAHSKEIGYDMSQSMILTERATPTYMAILNEDGEMVSAVADMSVIEAMTEEFIHSKREMFENSEYTFLDADDPKKLEYILTKFHGKTKFILDPISSTKALGVKHLLKYFHTIKPNRLEAEVMVGFKIESEEDLKLAGKTLLDLGIENVFISLDEDGIFYMNKNISGRLKAKNVTVRNVTGAGDSFVAGLGYGYSNKLSLIETLKFAITMSTITISHKETIHPEMGYDKVMDIQQKLEWEEKTF
ncbi:MAG: carbohydrate kinase family protein [Fusobacteriaceae bacterium]